MKRRIIPPTPTKGDIDPFVPARRRWPFDVGQVIHTDAAADSYWKKFSG
jgi:hypothetical protein